MRDVWTHLIRIEAGRAVREAKNKELRKHKVKLKITKREQYIEHSEQIWVLMHVCPGVRLYDDKENEHVVQAKRIVIQPEGIQYAKDLWIDHNKMLINEHCSAIVRWDQI
jgi:hypothetical protein